MNHHQTADPQRIWRDADAEGSGYRPCYQWHDAVGPFLIGMLLLAFAGCFASRVAGQGILKKPVVETMKVPEWLWPHIEVPKHIGPPKEVVKLVDPPDWIFFPKVEVPEYIGPKVAAKNFRNGARIRFDTWLGAEIWVADNVKNLPPGASRDGLPYQDRGWKSLGWIEEWTAAVSDDGLATEMFLAASKKDGTWVMSRVMVRPGLTITVKLK